MNLVAPFGFFGAGNIGDEATLQGFARLIANQGNGFKVWVASRNPSHTSQVEPSFKYYRTQGTDLRKKWARMRSAGHVMVGGTPIMDVLGSWPLNELVPLVDSAFSEKKPIVFLGVGTEKLSRDKSKRLMLESLAPKVDHWTVRSIHDKKRLEEYGVACEHVTVAADLAWLLEPVSDQFGRQLLRDLGVGDDKPLIGVNVNSEKFVVEQQPQLFEKIARFLDHVVDDYGARILFLCNEVRGGETYDKIASQKVVERMAHSSSAVIVQNHYWTPQQMLSLIGCCMTTIGIRYHFCLFSALQGVPFIALQRSDKVTDLCRDMDWRFGTSLPDLKVKQLSEFFSQIQLNRDECIQSMRTSVKTMRDRTQNNEIALKVLTNKVGK